LHPFFYFFSSFLFFLLNFHIFLNSKAQKQSVNQKNMSRRIENLGLKDFGSEKRFLSVSDPKKISFISGERRVLDYDGDSGKLKLNKEMFFKGTLERLMALIGKNQDEASFEFSVPFEKRYFHLSGIKSVEYFKPEEVTYVEREGYLKSPDVLPQTGNIIPRKRYAMRGRGLLRRMVNSLKGN